MPIEVKQREAIFYKTVGGVEPVHEFILKLKDRIGQAKIRTKIRKAEKGNFGQEGVGYRHIQGMIWELKVHYGPGYRVYFALNNDEVIVLLIAGDKKSQDSDIEQAQRYLDDYRTQKDKS